MLRIVMHVCHVILNHGIAIHYISLKLCLFDIKSCIILS